MDQKMNPWPIVGAIIVAGGLIALAVFYSRPGQPSSSTAANVGGNTQPASKVSIGDDVVLGDPNAPVTFIEFGDYQCPFCARFFQDTEPTIRDKYVKTGKVKFVYRDLAILGQESAWAALASECAHEQGKFWEYHDLLFNKQNDLISSQKFGENIGTLSKDNLKRWAGELGLDQNKFNSCLDSEKYTGEIQKDLEEGRAAGVGGTPSSFINGEMVRGALPLAEFERIIEEKLAEAQNK